MKQDPLVYGWGAFAGWQTGTCSDDINTFQEVVVGFIGKLVGATVRKTTIKMFPNQKPLMHEIIHHALKSHTTAYDAGLTARNMDEFASYDMHRVVKQVKWHYGKKLEMQFQQIGSRNLWQRIIMEYKTPFSRMYWYVDESLADELSSFYTCFEAGQGSASTLWRPAQREWGGVSSQKPFEPSTSLTPKNIYIHV